MGAKRWIDLGFTRIQPSELTKLAIVVMLAKYFYKIQSTHLNDVPRLLLAILAVIIPDILVIKQPDLGTGIIILIIATVMFFATGVDIKKFIVVGIGTLISLPLLWSLLHDYQRKRMLMFLNPDDDPLGSGYNIIQSKIAIGSGGALGKGLSHGTQSHLRFLPEYQTDFIFATFAEEFGFVGCIALICLYALIIMHCLSIAANAKNQFSKLLVIGITTTFFCHVFINIAMVMGMMPVVGVPLPLLSYGGTMLFSMLIGFALIANVHVHKYANL